MNSKKIVSAAFEQSCLKIDNYLVRRKLYRKKPDLVRRIFEGRVKIGENP